MFHANQTLVLTNQFEFGARRHRLRVIQIWQSLVCSNCAIFHMVQLLGKRFEVWLGKYYGYYKDLAVADIYILEVFNYPSGIIFFTQMGITEIVHVRRNRIAKKIENVMRCKKKRNEHKLCIVVLIHFTIFKIGGLMVWSGSCHVWIEVLNFWWQYPMFVTNRLWLCLTLVSRFTQLD